MTLGARVVAINADNEICLVRHTYTKGWHLPGGGVEKGETTLQTAIKEAREEAGLIIAQKDIHLVSIHANFANFKGDHVLIYRAEKWTSEPTNREHEIAECRFFPVNALPDGTTGGTRRRINEALHKSPTSENW